MAKNKVELTGVNTSSIKVLSQEEMTELFAKLKNGDSSARDDLVQGNLKLVLSIIKNYIGKAENLDDLFQIGCIGLLKAIDNFDLEHNVKFSTYAVPMILGEVKRYIRDNNSIRVSRSVKDLAYKTLRMKELLTNQYGREATMQEISKELGIQERDLVNALEALREPVSMFEPIYNDGGDTIYLFDQIEDKKDYYNLDTHISLNKALNNIDPRERDILIDRFLIGKTQMEISDALGISQAQVSRLEKTAIENVKKLIL